MYNVGLYLPMSIIITNLEFNFHKSLNSKNAMLRFHVKNLSSCQMDDKNQERVKKITDKQMVSPNRYTKA